MHNSCDFLKAAIGLVAGVFWIMIPAEAVENQGLDDTTGTIHNGAWHDGVLLGSLGTGRVELLPSGWFSRFSFNHNWDDPIPSDPWSPARASFFAIRTAETGAATTPKSVARWLRFGWREQELPGVTQVDHIAYHGLFPFIDATFTDPALPVQLALHAWSPLIPHNIKDSSMPVAFFEFTVENPTATAQEVSLLFSLDNLVGCGGYRLHEQRDRWRDQAGNHVEPVTIPDSPLTGARFFSTNAFEGMKLNSTGEYWLLSDGPTTGGGWNAPGSGSELVEEFSRSGELKGLQSATTAGAICRKITLPAHGKQKLIFTLIWWMPHHVTLDGKDHGHYYLREFATPQALAGYATAQRERLAQETLAWGKLLTDSNLPEWLKRMILDFSHPIFGNTVLTRDGEFSVHEDPSWMEGALGTLDQRTVAHAFVGAFFPELSRTELGLFGKCQQPSGELSHFVGNIYQCIGDPRVFYGITRWPDLSEVYIWQVLKHYRWTGDRAFLDQAWPGVKRALDWIASTDLDGDGIPEGGTTYDAGIRYAGGFIFTASVYGAALQSAIEMASVEGDAATKTACAEKLERLRATLKQRLWTGRYYAKCYLPENGNAVVPTLFTSQLAGDWLTRIIGLPRVVGASEAQSSLQSLFEVNGRRSDWMLVDEFMADGSAHNDQNWFTYQWTYFGGLATAEGFVDDSLEITWRVADALYRFNGSPWAVPITFSPRLTSPPSEGSSYMSAMAGWWWLYQLAGASVDVPGGTLFISPRPATYQPELHMPLFFPRTWFWLDYAPAKNLFQLKVLKTFGEPVSFKRVAGDPNQEAIVLPEPFLAKEGAVLDLAPWRARLVTVTARPPLLPHLAFQSHREGLPNLNWTATALGPTTQYRPDQAFDGIRETRWQTADPANKDQWWTLDFGRNETFKSIEALSEPAELIIELSDDGKRWTPLDSKAEKHQARYVRLHPNPPTATKDPWVLREVTVRP